MTISILGAGMAGFGAAYQLDLLGIPAILYEKEMYHGGHTASFVFEGGFVFDEGPHISFTKDPRIKELFAKSVNQEFLETQAHINNFWKGQWIRHPAQLNLHGLPADLLVKILCDFIDGFKEEPGVLQNYAEWLVANFGKTFAETFPMEYAKKVHTTDARNLTTDWMGPRMYKPKLEEVLQGALFADHPNVHYVTDFRYPMENGFVSYLNMFLKKTDLKLGHQVVGIDPRSRELHFSNGKSAGYEGLLSSIPLPDLVPMISGAPPGIMESAKRLACSGIVIVNIGVDREDLSEAQISYFYEQDIVFTRVNFPHMLSPNNVPPGAGSIQAEIYFSTKYKPLDRPPNDFIKPAIQDLRRCGLLRGGDRILFENAMFAPYANIIFDHDRTNALKRVHEFLDEVGIGYCGRYGEWGYLWTDESFISGERAARNILARLNGKS